MRVHLLAAVTVLLFASCTSKPETDPVFSGSASAQVSSTDIARWNQAATTVSDAGPLVEKDPLFSASPASTISSDEIANWNLAYGWGDHAAAGYLKTEIDPKVGALAEGDVPRWSAGAGALATGAIRDTGATVSLGTGNSTAPLVVIGSQYSSATVDQQNAGNGPYFPTGPFFQTFTAGKTGSLIAVDLMMDATTMVDITLTDTSGAETLASTSCAANGSGWTSCGFPLPAQVTSGTHYQLNFIRRSTDGAVSVAANGSDNYPAGAMGGANVGQDWDLAFKTEVGDLESGPVLEVGARVSVKSLFHLAPRTTAPADPVEGDVYYDAIDHVPKYWNGSSWMSL